MSFPFGDNVRKLREKQGLSQEELARRSRLSKDHVSKIERGEKCNPALLTMESLALALGVSLSDLLGGTVKSMKKKMASFAEVRTATIPVVGLARAGKGGFFDDAGYPRGQGHQSVAVPTEFVARHPHCYGLRVEGESMLPSLKPGWVVVAAPDLEPSSGGLTVARFKNGEVMVKELRQQNRTTVILKSHNPGFDPLVSHRRDFQFIHKIICIIPK